MLNTMYAPLVDFLPLSLANRVASEGPAAANASSGRAGNAVAPGTGAVPASIGEKSRGQVGYDVDGDADSYDDDKKQRMAGGAADPAAKAANAAAAGDPAGLQTNMNARNNDGLNTGPESKSSPHDFTHPVVHAAPAVIWLPVDALGFAKGEVEGCRAAGIDAAADARLAVMDERGKVRVEENAVPPGEEEIL